MISTEPIKVFGEKMLGAGFSGNALTRKAKRLNTAYAMKNVKIKDNKKGMIRSAINTGLQGTILGFSQQAGNSTIAILSGITSTCFGTSFVLYLKDFIKAFKGKAKIQKEMKDMINNSEFMEIINKYLVKKGQKTMTAEEVLEYMKSVHQ